jgi:hypothetical protein
LLEVSKFTQVHFFRELPADRADQVLVEAEPAAGERPLSGFRLECTLPQQHMKCGFPRADIANLEHDGEHLVCSVNMGHVFDYKSKTSTE